MALGNFQSVVLRAAGWQPAVAAAGHAWAMQGPLVAVVLAAMRPRTVLAVGAADGAGVVLGSLADAVQWLGLAASVCGAVHGAALATAPTGVGVLHLADVPPGRLAAALAHWQPVLADGAVVLVHGLVAHLPEWAALVAQKPHFGAPAGEGLGVLLAQEGAALPEGLRWLLDPSSPERQWALQDQDLAALFGALGAGAAARVALLGVQAGNTSLRLRLAAQNQNTEQIQQQTQAALRQAQLQMNTEQQAHQALLLALEQAREQLQASGQSLEQARQEAGMGAAALHQVHSSMSWRITAPLRKGLDAVRRLAQLARLTGSQGGGPVLAQAQQLIHRAQDALHGGPRLPTLTGDCALRSRWYEAKMPQVSLIVLNYNKPQLTLECVQSIWQYTEGYAYEIVLVDNGSADESLAQLAPLGVAAQLVRVGINRFFGEGNNIGFEASRGQYVVFLNNDVTVTPG